MSDATATTQDGTAADRTPERRPITRYYQTVSGLVANAILTVAVTIFVREGYPDTAGPSLVWFYGIEGLGAAVAALAALPDVPGRFVSWISRESQYTPSRRLQRYVDGERDEVLRKIVFVPPVAGTVALAYLVWRTGGGIESPFVPLLAAPAIFGPLLARKPQTVLVLVVVSSLVLASMGVVADRTICDSAECAALLEETAPDAWVYWGVSISLTVVSGLLSVLLMRGDDGDAVSVASRSAGDESDLVPVRD